MKNNKAIAIYLRLSKEDEISEKGSLKAQDESNSISSQRRLLREYIRHDAELDGADVLEFCDDGFSGTSMARPGIQALMEQVKENQIGCILVKDLSRFSRDYIELGTYMNQIFPFMGIRFISVNDHYDSSAHEGSTIGIDTAFKTLLYDLYSKDLSVKVKSSLQNKYANGEYVSGRVPLGYRKSSDRKNSVVVDEKEAEIVRYIFSLADAGGLGSTEIARRLIEEKVPAPEQIHFPEGRLEKANYTWNSAAVRNILNNRFYLGEMAYGKSVRKAVGSKSGTVRAKEEWQVIANHHEALVAREVFERVSRFRPWQSTKRKREKHPLTGKIYCGGCGYSLNYKPHSNHCKCRYFWCRKHSLLQIPECCTYFNAAILEEIVLKELYVELMRRGNLLKQRENLEESRKRIADELRRIRAECRCRYREVQAEKDVLYQNYAEKQIRAEEYRKRADELMGQMEELERRADEAKMRQEQMEEERNSDKQDMKQVIRFLDLTELTQEAVDAFIKKVTLYKDKRVEIEWNFAESAEDISADVT